MDGTKINFQTNNNIINFKNNEITNIQKSFNNNENNDILNSEILKHLIRHFFFKKELKKPAILSSNNLYQAFLIENNLI